MNRNHQQVAALISALQLICEDDAGDKIAALVGALIVIARDCADSVAILRLAIAALDTAAGIHAGERAAGSPS